MDAAVTDPLVQARFHFALDLIREAGAVAQGCLARRDTPVYAGLEAIYQRTLLTERSGGGSPRRPTA